jgi:glycine cleavage system transcriptional repressor
MLVFTRHKHKHIKCQRIHFFLKFWVRTYFNRKCHLIFSCVNITHITYKFRISMNQQIIVNILGVDKLGILSEISACVHDKCCNILDSRHAIYGKDFSLSMIVEGTQSAITKLELQMGSLCMQHDLLSMIKRTSGHSKQNLEQLINLEFSGEDAKGIIKQVTGFIAQRQVSVSAFRQKTFIDKTTNVENVRCKMVLSATKELNLVHFDEEIKQLMCQLGLSGKVTYNKIKEENEHIESW